MKLLDNSVIIGYVKDITVAKMQSWEHSACEKNGKDVADFMQQVYDKLCELNEKKN